jgi:secreted trypsin-like serine protease
MRNGLVIKIAQILVAIFVTACGSQQNSDLKIIGGDIVRARDPIATSVAALVTADGNVHCTVAPLSAKVFITAAHCVYGRQDYKDWSIVTGRNVSDGKSYALESIIVHEKFSSQELRMPEPSEAPNDVALIQVKEPVAGTIPVPIIRGLSGATEQMPMLVTVAGYGRSDGADKASKGILRKVTLPVVIQNTETHEFLTIDAQGRMGCHGDSGGPAFTTENGKLMLVGVVSRGDHACVKGQTVYTDLSEFRDFILKSLDTFGATRN